MGLFVFNAELPSKYIPTGFTTSGSAAPEEKKFSSGRVRSGSNRRLFAVDYASFDLWKKDVVEQQPE